MDEAKQWAIGDWLVEGKRHYGDKLYERAESVLGLDQGQLRKLKSISERFELLLRSNNLSWNHHYEVASIKTIGTRENGKLYLTDVPNHGAMQELLQQALKDKLSTRDLADLVSLYKRRQQEEIRLANEPERFAVILADPAWEYDFSKSDSRRTDNHYLSSSLEDMKRLKVSAAKQVSHIRGNEQKIVDVASAAEIYARRQQLGEEAIQYATSIKVEVLRQLGNMLKETPRNTGTRTVGGHHFPGGTNVVPPDETPTLAELGLTKKISKLAQDIADLPDEQFEKAVEGVITIARAQKKVKEKQRQEKRAQIAALGSAVAPSDRWHVWQARVSLYLYG